jgi:queuine tRNA-ribosyltransferase
MEIQYDLGSDIVMIFDECTPYPADWDYAKRSMEMSLRWAKRSRDRFDPGQQKCAVRHYPGQRLRRFTRYLR